LDWFRHRRLIKAESGADGGGNSRQGRRGQNLVLSVPCGTLVKDAETGQVLYDFVETGQEYILCQGGQGGRGNESFKTPTHRAPTHCTSGMPGEVKHVELELKLIADIGLIGFPNAGKSTLISSLAGIRAKVAAYPFTTLQPNLGFIELSDYTRLYLADIPGIIEGASRNRGLGLDFLRHIERTQLLVYVLDASGIDGRTPSDDFRVLRQELMAYRADLLERPSIVVLNKIDVPESLALIAQFKKDVQVLPGALFEISASCGQGLEALLQALAAHCPSGSKRELGAKRLSSSE